MKDTKRKRLEQAGFRVGSVQEFLDLSPEEMHIIELKLSLVELLRSTRKAHRLTQAGLAKLISSSQSRVAKMEGQNPDVSLELICRALFALGVSRKEIGKKIAGR